jgi:hypothetical protein
MKNKFGEEQRRIKREGLRKEEEVVAFCLFCIMFDASSLLPACPCIGTARRHGHGLGLLCKFASAPVYPDILPSLKDSLSPSRCGVPFGHDGFSGKPISPLVKSSSTEPSSPAS